MNSRVYLRTPALDDKSAIENAYERSQALHHPWIFAPVNIGQYLQQPCRYLVCDAESAAILGTFHISSIVRGCFQSAYLGFEAFLPYANQGFMSQGLQLLLNQAFTVLKLHRLEANIQPENINSKKLVSKLGFVQEGYSKQYLNVGGLGWKDHERWAIVAG